MPGLVRTGRKRPSPEELGESSESDQSTTPVSANGKRARYRRDASDSPAPTNGTRNRTHASNLSANDAYSDDVFQPGSIVRVKLKNFVTYTAAEFHLGPSLNMIIGPNGTGKSTLVCAICLGLGWSSEHLGRAKELSAFVKHGAAEGEIEIELAKAEGMQTNPVIRRVLRREGNKTVFFLNDKHATKSAVMDLCKAFSIQIDNLCQFLPQDRVVEFAKMKDTERLRATLGAAARPEMSEWHDQLKTLREEEKGVEVQRHNDEEHLKKLESLQNTTRGDVERYRKRQELASLAQTLEKVRPIIELRLRKDEYKQVKDDYSAAKSELEELENEIEPIQQAAAAAQTYHDQVDQCVQRRKKILELVKKQAEKKFEKISANNKTIEDNQGQISGEMRSKQGRQQDIARSTRKVADLERKRQEQPVAHDQASFQQRKDELRQEFSSTERSITTLKGTLSSIKARIGDYNGEKTAIEQQLARLDTQSGKQASLLRKISPHTAQAWTWFEENKGTLPLKGEVHGPAILTCSITDPKHADAVESQLRLGDVVAITCTNSEDQRLLLRKLTDRTGLGLHGIFLRTSPKPLSAYQPPVAASDLAQYGFEGYLRDCVTGPDPVIAMLCDNVRLNKVAFAAKAITNQQHAAVSNSPIQTWVSGRDVFKISTRREYGASSTMVTHLTPGKYFVDQAVNSDEKTQLDEALQRLKREFSEMVAQHTAAKSELTELSEKSKAVKEQRDEVLREENDVKKAIAEWRNLPRLIDQHKNELQQMVDLNAKTSDRIREIKAQSRQCSLKIAELTLEYAKSVIEFRRHHENVTEAEIRLIEAASEVRALENENKMVLERLRSKRVQVEQLGQIAKTMREEVRQARESAQAFVENCTPEETEILRKYKDLASVAELEDEIKSVNARLEMMSGGSERAVREFENRGQQIQKTRESLEKHVADLEETQSKIKDIKDPFEEELDALIAKISDAFAHNFAQIGCAGEVSVYKDDDDFNAWSIQISVRFREGESMSVLNANRQSGGERAVSTIFYLMALQDLAQAPFRVVDEINQGMDPRNERMVHERMVDIACQERTSQYFLITPKLLSGLKFHPKMKVHIINSGEHVPKSTTTKDEWNLKDMARVALAVRGRVSATA